MRKQDQYIRGSRPLATALVLGATALVAPAPAAADHALLVVDDPTPSGSFSGSYAERGDKPQTKKKDESRYAEQDGHVAVYEEGVVACNGSTAYAPYDQDGDGTNDPLQGYVWVGPELAATGDQNAALPGEYAGVGSNHGKLSHEPTGEPPCPEADPGGDGPG
jgi:hypothetical protein